MRACLAGADGAEVAVAGFDAAGTSDRQGTIIMTSIVDSRTFPRAPLPGSTASAFYAEAPADRHQQQTETDEAVDQALADSFPASDPPPWTPGAARPRPAVSQPRAASGEFGETSRASGRAADEAASRRSYRPVSRGPSFFNSIGSIAGAMGLALLAPFAIILIGIPLVFILRLLVEAAGWAVSLVS